MRISQADWIRYIGRLAKIDNIAATKVRQWVEKNGLNDLESLTAYAYAVSTKYGEASAALAAEMYDATAAAAGVAVPTAEVAATATYDDVARAIHGTAKRSENPNYIGNSIGRLVKRAGADTTLKNAERDGAQFAWIPMGDTCAFCLTLASRGWQYMSKKAMKGGHAEHIHANCDCTYAVRFDGKSSVQGYNPDKYLKMYYGAEGSTPKDRINAMRRSKYAADPEKYRAQKRQAYARLHGGKFKNKLDDGSRIVSTANEDSIVYKTAKKMQVQIGDDAIIRKIGREDSTDGSCTSQALAYIGNKAGYDVKDFRGGRSCALFQQAATLKEIVSFDGVIGYIEEDYNDYSALRRLFKNAKDEKEYLLSTGKHTTIIKKIDNHWHYLELQTDDENGYYKLTNDILKNRFYCQKTHSIGGEKTTDTSFLIEADSLMKSEKFIDMLGYINTVDG